MSITNIFVIGAGTMGNGIAQTAATSGFDVTMMDVFPAALEKGCAAIAKSANRLFERQPTRSSDAALSLKTAATCRASRGRSRDRSRHGKSGAEAQSLPDVMLAAGYDSGQQHSSISITRIAGATARPDRVIGMHFMNPVPLMQLVEIVRGLDTSEETAATITDLARQMGKTPVEANDAPGFISNRILCPMINEAIFALQEGVGTAEAIDSVMKLGMNHPMGPLGLADLIGLDVVLFILEVLQRDLGEDKYRPAYLLRKMVAAGHLGRKSGKGFYNYA
jgi:3-hydroxybutyryl-CoA dehydrogenase